MRVCLWAALLWVSACGPVPAADWGAELVREPRFSDSASNRFACTTCHATSAEDTRRLSGYPLYGAAFRASWWGGAETRLLDAVNFCYVGFMRGVTPLGAEEPRSRALYEYLVRLSPGGPAPALPFTVVRDVVDVPRGDAGRGRALYVAACQECHGEVHTGRGRLSERASILPEVADEYPRMFPGVSPGVVVIEKVRHGRFFGVGGDMPLYSLEALSDEELGALLAYLGL